MKEQQIINGILVISLKVHSFVKHCIYLSWRGTPISPAEIICWSPPWKLTLNSWDQPLMMYMRVHKSTTANIHYLENYLHWILGQSWELLTEFEWLPHLAFWCWSGVIFLPQCFSPLIASADLQIPCGFSPCIHQAGSEAPELMFLRSPPFQTSGQKAHVQKVLLCLI